MRKTQTILLTLLLLLAVGSAEGARKKVIKPIDPQKELKDKLNRYFNGYTVSTQKLRNRSKLTVLNINDSLRTIEVSADTHFGEQVFTPETVGSIYDDVRALMPDSIQTYQLTIKTGGWSLEQLVPNRLKLVEDKTRSWGDINYKGKPWVNNASRPFEITHGLWNRHLCVWASHGRYFHIKDSVWKWQRPPLFGTREDLFTQTIVTPYLIPMLERAGAVVFSPRERDWQRNEVIVDNDTPESGYRESYVNHRWSHCDSTGFGFHPGVYVDMENPFEQGTSRQTETTDNQNHQSTVIWRPAIPEAGRYAVYVSYQTLEKSIDDAHYTVWHQGVPTEFRVNQQMGGRTWVYLGSFDFDAGQSDRNCVTLSNLSKHHHGVVTADAVRFGGGMGNIRRGYSTSGLPRCLEGSRYYAQWAGMP